MSDVEEIILHARRKKDALFTVVSDAEVREAEAHRERAKRDPSTIVPSTEAVQAKMGLPYSCQVCGKRHYPRSGTPKKCTHGGIAKMPGFSNGLELDRLGEGFAMYYETSPQPKDMRERASRIDYGDDEDSARMAATADVLGDARRRYGEWNDTRKKVIRDSLTVNIKTDIEIVKKHNSGRAADEDADESIDIDADESEEEERGLHTLTLTNGVQVSVENFLRTHFPTFRLLTLGSGNTRLLDVSQNGEEALIHVSRRYDFSTESKGITYNTQYRERTGVNVRHLPYIYHEHYYLKLRDKATRDCDVWEVPTEAVRIKNARAAVEGGKAGKLR